MKKPLRRISVSDHAVVRYLERVHGVDIAQLRKEIVADRLRHLISIKNNNTGIFSYQYQVQPIITTPPAEIKCEIVIERGTIITIQIKDR